MNRLAHFIAAALLASDAGMPCEIMEKNADIIYREYIDPLISTSQSTSYFP